MKLTLCILALSITSIAMAGISDGCYTSYSKGKDAFERGATYSRAAEKSRQRILKAQKDLSIEDFCIAAKEGEEQAHQGVKAFLNAREEFGNAYITCSSPNDDKAHEASENAGKQVDQLLAFSSEAIDGMNRFCED